MLKTKFYSLSTVAVLSLVSCSSTSNETATQFATPTTLDGRSAYMNKYQAKYVMELIFRKIDVDFPDVKNNPTNMKIQKITLYREKIKDIVIADTNFNEFGLNISLNSLRNYIFELVQYVDVVIDDFISGSQEKLTVSVSTFAYHLAKFESIKQCYLDLREDC